MYLLRNYYFIAVGSGLRFVRLSYAHHLTTHYSEDWSRCNKILKTAPVSMAYKRQQMASTIDEEKINSSPFAKKKIVQIQWICEWFYGVISFFLFFVCLFLLLLLLLQYWLVFLLTFLHCDATTVFIFIILFKEVQQ